MSRELDYKIAKWLGWKYEEVDTVDRDNKDIKKFYWTDSIGHIRFENEIPHYEDCGTAFQLLPLLDSRYNEQKYKISLENNFANQWHFSIFDPLFIIEPDRLVIESGWCNSIGEAICIVVEILIDNEI